MPPASWLLVLPLKVSKSGPAAGCNTLRLVKEVVEGCRKELRQEVRHVGDPGACPPRSSLNEAILKFEEFAFSRELCTL